MPIPETNDAAETNETANTAWLEVMPTMPLARGVVVIDEISRIRGVVFGDAAELYVQEDGGTAIFGPVDSDPTCDWRADLADPQGFGYALLHHAQIEDGADHDPFRIAGHRADARMGSPWRLTPLMKRHLIGQTTDADRLAVARAIAEVQS